jgi:hypothetical protein
MRRGRGAGLRKEMGQQAESRERGRNGFFLNLISNVFSNGF